MYDKNTEPYHFGENACKAEKNVAIALRNFYAAKVEYHLASLRYFQNSKEVAKSFAKWRQAKEDLGVAFATNLGDQYGVEYRIWAHDTMHEGKKIPMPETIKG